MNKLRTTLTLVAGLLSINAAADTSSLTTTVGGTQLTVPSPAGYHEISTLSPEARTIAEQMTPESNRLLGIFVSEADLGLVLKGELPAFSRYMLLQSNRQFESYDLTEKDFHQLSSEIEKRQKLLLANVNDDIARQFDRSSKSISEQYKTDFSLRAGEQAPLGVYLEEPRAFGFAMLSKYQTEISGTAEDLVVVGGANFLMAENKLLYAYVYSNFDSQDDIDWVRKTSKSWTGAVIAANPSKTRSTSGSSLIDGIDWDEALAKGVAGGLAAGFLVLVISVIRWLGSLLRRNK